MPLAVLLSLSIALASACGTGGDEPEDGVGAGGLRSWSYRTDYLPNGFYGPLVYADKKGFYEEEGLDFELLYGKGSTVTAQDVATGRTDSGDVASSVLALSVDKGANIKGVGALTAEFEFGFFVPQDSEIESFEDLEGSSVAFSPGTPQAALIDGLWRQAGVPADSIENVVVDAAAAIPAYADGRVDVIAESIPYGGPSIQAERPSRVLPWTDAGFVMPDYSFIVNGDVLETRPEDVAGFLRATYRGFAEGYENKEEMLNLYAEANPEVPTDVIGAQIDEYSKFFCSQSMIAQGTTMGYQVEDDWEAGLELMREYQGLANDIAVDDIVTNQFFDAPHDVSKETCAAPVEQ